MQEGINPFREHVAIVLHESALNEIKGTPEYFQANVSISDASNSDCMIVDDPKQLDLTDGVVCRNPVHIIPTDPQELFDRLCKQIMSIQDPKSLE